MSIEENKALVRRYFEEAPYQPDTCDEIFAGQVLWHALYQAQQSSFISSPDEEKKAYAWHEATWGRWCESIEEMIAEGDRVLVRWSFHGVHQGEFMGMPPTHKTVSFSGIYIFRIANGRIAEVWNLWDRLGEWQQLGILPDTEEILQKAQVRKSSTT